MWFILFTTRNGTKFVRYWLFGFYSTFLGKLRGTAGGFYWLCWFFARNKRVYSQFGCIFVRNYALFAHSLLKASILLFSQPTVFHFHCPFYHFTFFMIFNVKLFSISSFQNRIAFCPAFLSFFYFQILIFSCCFQTTFSIV